MTHEQRQMALDAIQARKAVPWPLLAAEAFKGLVTLIVAMFRKPKEQTETEVLKDLQDVHYLLNHVILPKLMRQDEEIIELREENSRLHLKVMGMSQL